MSIYGKKQMSIHLLTEYEAMLACPICSGPIQVMQAANTGSLRCSRGHCFDIAKQGYVNLLPHPPRGAYDKPMFEARRRVSASGFFEPLLERISGRISRELAFDAEPPHLLDAGCGEGSALARIVHQVHERTSAKLLGIGVDISKEAIRIAARESSRAIWCVSDLARCPFADRTFSFILNLLSPSNYAEFRRLLSDDGMVIKVIPGSAYLRELREVLYRQTDRQHYDNELTAALFGRHFHLIETESVQYRLPAGPAFLEDVIRMTPLSWGAPGERIRQALHMENAEITADFTILYGKNK
ncbi:methyltransferase domain-containing protein [Paenibacillus thiaminolyticus]|uniref:putative RNA methyltransferase n=1 Tax=Paenibacillus thiaminolyticus TaxID=49283 RepID=UPI00232B3EB0|nr:methyltransferase domain-containing protein [Paenibacillus thiaminolyticus]WCF07282.1 methyltransferase domain-containing protein [Paenibacillus thiaminolyticus]